MKRILVFASGSGSNFEAIVNYFADKNVQIELLCDKKDAFALKRAARLKIKSYYVRFNETYDFLKNKEYDLYVLAGYMRILPKNVLELGTFINIHPSLLPEFKGLNAIKRAYAAKADYSGVSVHFVNEKVDCGQIIQQHRVKLNNSDTYEEFEERIHSVEHKIYPKIIEELLK